MQAGCQRVRNLPFLSHKEPCGEPWRKEEMLSPARKTRWKRQISPTGGQIKLPLESSSYKLICNGFMNWILGFLTTNLNSSTSIFKICLKRNCFFLQFWMFLWQNHFFSSGFCLLSLKKKQPEQTSCFLQRDEPDLFQSCVTFSVCSKHETW